MEIKVYQVPGAMIKEVPQFDPVKQSHWAWEHQAEYVHVGTVICDTPEEAYDLTNNVDNEWEEDDDRVELEVDCPRGTKVGDVFYQNGYPYVVGDFGKFLKVERPPTESELKKQREAEAAVREKNKTPAQREMEGIAREALREIEEATKNNIRKPPGS